MKILDIENRTENWKTAYYFAPFFKCEAARRRLVERLSEPEGTKACDININLFWKGMRDYLDDRGGKKPSDDEDFVERYKRLFVEELDLRKNIKEFIAKRRKAREPRFWDLRSWNYCVSEPTKAELGSNLYETEIDVVLCSSRHLFIGEAKYESLLGGESKYVLVHQLIRQYVMARILVDKLVSENRIAPKKVIPFFVRDKPEGREQAQVEFMIQQGWMRENNVLTWEDIKEFWPSLAAK